MSERVRQALITGASSDIGIEICRAYLGQGYRVIGLYHRGQDTFFDLADTHAELTPLQIDLGDPTRLEQMIAENLGIFSASDVFVSGAAILEPAPFAKVTADSLLHHFKINLIPGILLMRTLVPFMTERGWGRIVHLGSIGVRFGGGSESFCYALSKHAVEFLPADYKSWARHNVFVNTLRIGVTDTRFHRQDPGKDMTERVSLIPAGRMASPQEIADVVYWFGSESNTYITGETVAAAGGE